MDFWDLMIEKTLDRMEKEKREVIRDLTILNIISFIVGVIIGYYLK